MNERALMATWQADKIAGESSESRGECGWRRTHKQRCQTLVLGAENHCAAQMQNTMNSRAISPLLPPTICMTNLPPGTGA